VARVPPDGPGVSKGCFQPQARGSVIMHAIQNSVGKRRGHRSSETRGAGGSISINQGGEGARATSTHRQAERKKTNTEKTS